MSVYRVNSYQNKLQLIGVHSVKFSDNPASADWAYPVPTLWINTSSNSTFLLVATEPDNATWIELSQSTSSFTQGNDALSIYDITVAPPASPSAGDAYILSETGTRDSGWTNLGATYNDYVIYDGTSWKVNTPDSGTIVYVENLNQLHIFNGTDWKTLHELLPFDFQQSVLAIADPTIAPPTENVGDRYILDDVVGSVHAGWDGGQKKDIVEFNGVTWQRTAPNEGMMTAVEDLNTVYFYVTSWSPLVTNVGLDIATDSGNATPNASGELTITGDDTSGVDTAGSSNTVTISLKQASTTQRGSVELATDVEAQGKSDTARALTASNLASLGASDTFAGLIEIATNAEADAGVATDKALVPSNLPSAVPAHVPSASTTTQGKVELATDAEAQAKSDTGRALTPSNLASLGASDTFSGLVELATNAEAQAKSDSTRALTPANLSALGSSDSFAGLVELATNAEAVAESSTTLAITPANLDAVLSAPTAIGDTTPNTGKFSTLETTGNAGVGVAPSGTTGNRLYVKQDHNNTTQIIVENTTDGTSSMAQVSAISDGSKAVNILVGSASYTGQTRVQGRGEVQANSSASGLNITTLNASGNIKFYREDTLLGNASSAGIWTQPLQPSFNAYKTGNSTNVTGDGTAYTVTFDGEVSDRGGNFNTGTYTFTAPADGDYLLTAKVYLANIAAAHTGFSLDLVTSNRTYRTDFKNSSTGNFSVQITQLADMDTNDTATVQITVSGSTKTVAVTGQANTAPYYMTTFSGFLRG